MKRFAPAADAGLLTRTVLLGVDSWSEPFPRLARFHGACEPIDAVEGVATYRRPGCGRR